LAAYTAAAPALPNVRVAIVDDRDGGSWLRVRVFGMVTEPLGNELSANAGAAERKRAARMVSFIR
jgi:uncharacterized protein (DUF2141 family)